MSDFNQSKNVKDWHRAGMDPSLFPKRKPNKEKEVKIFYFDWFFSEGLHYDHGTSKFYDTEEKAEAARKAFLADKGICKSQSTHWEYKTSKVKNTTVY